MRIPPVDLGYLLDRSRELCGRVAEAWEDAARDASGPAGPEGVAAGIDHLFAVLEDLDRTSPTGPRARPSATELRDLAAYGVGLLGDLAACARRVGMDGEAPAEALTVPFSVLMARQGAELSALEPVVNALAALANTLSEPGDLAQLFGLMGEIVSAVTPSVARGCRPHRAATAVAGAAAEPRDRRHPLPPPGADGGSLRRCRRAPAARGSPVLRGGNGADGRAGLPAPGARRLERYYLRQGPAPHTLH